MSFRPCVAVVDVYTCSEFLVTAFTDLGFDVVQVRWRPEVAPAVPGMAYAAVVTGQDREALATELATHAPVAVVAGQEPDVPVADFLSERLGLATNGSALSAARRDKYVMSETLRRAGVRCVEQFKSDDVEAIVAWARDRGRFPVVVKPLASAATDGVAICADLGQVHAAATGLLGTSTIFEEPNDEVVVQEYLVGPEYVVDMVSCDGRRYTCGVWEYHKRLIDVHNVYDREIALPADERPVPELVAYVDDVLTALGIHHGPTHAEVIVTADGPTLVEVGARTAGNMHPGFHDRCLGGNQAALTALAYARPEEFLDRFAGGRYTRLLDACVYTTPTEQDGVVARIDRSVLDRIEALDTVWGVVLKVAEGGRIRPTIDLKSSTMKIFMAGGGEAAVLDDYRMIQKLKDEVFELA